jgi:hypothetical protein
MISSKGKDRDAQRAEPLGGRRNSWPLVEDYQVGRARGDSFDVGRKPAADTGYPSSGRRVIALAGSPDETLTGT